MASISWRVPASAGAALLRGACAAATLLLGACASSAPIRTDVVTPPPAAPTTEFFVEKADVHSRETGDEAWRRNQEYGRQLTQGLTDALARAGKRLSTPPARAIRSRIYLAWNDPVRKKGVAQGEKARVEILLQLLDGDSRTVLYSTLTRADIAPRALGGYAYGDDRDVTVTRALAQAVEDFVKRL